MIKMLIQMDNRKIIEENKYQLEEIYMSIDRLFKRFELPRLSFGFDGIIYKDNGSSDDFSHFGLIVTTLKKLDWFMNNVSTWRYYESDDSTNPEDFYEEDFLLFFKKKQAMEG